VIRGSGVTDATSALPCPQDLFGTLEYQALRRSLPEVLGKLTFGSLRAGEEAMIEFIGLPSSDTDYNLGRPIRDMQMDRSRQPVKTKAHGWLYVYDVSALRIVETERARRVMAARGMATTVRRLDADHEGHPS
jgi:hypothetical protein